jgi:hypothetical protein
MPDPFLVADVKDIRTLRLWADDGTGGPSWSINRVQPVAGYASVGDLCMTGKASIYSPYDASVGGHTFFDSKVLLVRANRPDAAVPCEGYRAVVGIQKGVPFNNFYIPIHSNPDYIAVGHCLGHMHQTIIYPPPTGYHYMVHKKYLKDNGAIASLMHQEDFNVYRTVPNMNTFRVDDRQSYSLITDAMLAAEEAARRAAEAAETARKAAEEATRKAAEEEARQKQEAARLAAEKAAADAAAAEEAKRRAEEAAKIAAATGSAADAAAADAANADAAAAVNTAATSAAIADKTAAEAAAEAAAANTETGPSTGLVIGILAVILLAIVGAVMYSRSGKKSPQAIQGRGDEGTGDMSEEVVVSSTD